MEDEHEERAAELIGVTGVFSDLLTGALGSVNWYEIAGSLIEDCELEDEEETTTV